MNPEPNFRSVKTTSEVYVTAELVIFCFHLNNTSMQSHERIIFKTTIKDFELEHYSINA